MGRVAILLTALLLAGCEQELSNEKVGLLEAVVFAFDNVENNQQEEHRLRPWKREMAGQTIVFSTLGRNSIGTSDEETNAKIRDSSFIRYTEKISSSEKCVFRRESLMEFSKGDSTTDFSVYDMGSGTVIINLMNAYRFELVYDPPEANINLQGPSVACYNDGSCVNLWDKVIFPEDYYSYNDKPPSVLRRERAVELIKKVCPGKPY
jgi:hypothetical protein